MVGLDLGGSDLRDVLEVEGHVGRFAFLLSGDSMWKSVK